MKRLTAELSWQMKEGQKLDQEIKKNPSLWKVYYQTLSKSEVRRISKRLKELGVFQIIKKSYSALLVIFSASLLRSSALSVFSQVKSGSSLPKCP